MPSNKTLRVFKRGVVCQKQDSLPLPKAGFSRSAKNRAVENNVFPIGNLPKVDEI